MSSRRSQSERRCLFQEFGAGFVSAFDFGGWLVEEILDNEEAALRRDADRLAEDGRKIMGDLREAERRVHEQG